VAGLELTSLAEHPSAETPPELEVLPSPSEEAAAAITDDTPVPESFEAMVKRTPEASFAPIDLAPLVDVPPADETAQDEEPADVPSVPVLHDTALHDPLAGLDVISPPQESVAANAFDETPGDDDEYVDLAEWLERTRTPTSTRMVAHDEEPEDNEQKDFAEMLEKFKTGVARSVDDTDFDSHYDLGIAFREMGLVDEAINAFQKATRGQSHRIRASEALGECFLYKGQPKVAATVLNRIISEEHRLDDDQLIGVLYLLGRAAEDLDKPAEAETFYQRVVAVNMGFKDAAKRLSSRAKAHK
jgi:tetratricopeptide (TPR) repeat protein